VTKANPTEQDKAREQVKTLLGVGVGVEDVCRITINPRTGQPYDVGAFVVEYQKELATAEISANALVLANLFKHATGSGKEAVKAALHWVSTHQPKGEEDDLETRIKKALLMSERMMNRGYE
jgi:hypothetical protein